MGVGEPLRLRQSRCHGGVEDQSGEGRGPRRGSGPTSRVPTDSTQMVRLEPTPQGVACPNETQGGGVRTTHPSVYWVSGRTS